VRIEPGQHPGDRRADQLCVADRVDRITANALEGLAEQGQLFVSAGLAALRLGGC